MKTMSKWISVKDRLPKDSSPVLTVCSNVYGEMVLALNDYDSECEDSPRRVYWRRVLSK